MDSDTPYIPPPETQFDKDSRMYVEADALQRVLVESISKSNLDGPAKTICLYNVQTQWLDRLLNDYYDMLAITSHRDNPFVYMEDISNTKARVFKKRGGTAGFADLSLGVKYLALVLFHYKTKEDEEEYQDFLKDLFEFIEVRNDFIHDLFTQKLESKKKYEQIAMSLAKLFTLNTFIGQKDSQLAEYLFDNVHRYWGSSAKNVEHMGDPTNE